MEKSINRKADSADALKEKIVSSIISDYVDNLHTRYRTISGIKEDDVYSSVKDMGYKIGDTHTFNGLNSRLRKKSVRKVKVELLQRLLDEYTYEQELYEKELIKQQIEEYKLSSTQNPNLMVSPEGRYFRICDGIIEDSRIVAVNEDGSYIVHIPMQRSNDILVTTYSIDDKPIVIKIMNQKSIYYSTESYVAKKLNLKREYVKKYKLHGYSGNSSGFISTIKNMVTQPLPSGCYLHENYNFYKWSMKHSQFEIQMRQGVNQGSPMLADYDIKEDRVIRTDYDGAGIYL